MKNRLRQALVLVAVSALFMSPGVSAFADDAVDSTVASVEAAKEASVETPAEETKKTEEAPAVPEKDMQVAPVGDPVVADVPDPVVVAPAPPVEQPAPAPAAPEPAVPAAPVAPPVPELPATPAKDAVIDDPAPVVVVPPVEEETPPGDPAPSEDATPVINVNVMITTVQEINAQGWIFLTAETQNVAPGATIGTYTVNLTGAKSQLGVNTATLVVGDDGTASRTLWWECATPGATISVTGPNGLVPIFNEIDGTTATTQTLPILGTPGCGTTTPTKEVKYVTPEAPKFNPAGPGVHGSITYPTTEGVVYTADPVGATEGPVKVTATAAPETDTVIWKIDPNAQTVWSGDLGEFSDVVPNPGGNPAYGDASVVPSGAAAITPDGLFNTTEYVFPSVSGTSKDGSPVTVKLEEPIKTQGGSDPITAQLNLTGMCGLAHWSWYASDNESGSPKWTIGAGIVELPACDSNQGIDSAYKDAWMLETGEGGLTPAEKFLPDTVYLSAEGLNSQGKSFSVQSPSIKVDGSKITTHVDLSKFCGWVHWSWVAKNTDSQASSERLIRDGTVYVGLCDGGNGDNPGDGDSDHHHDGDCYSRNQHSCEPDNKGPVGTPGDLNNDGVEADASANNVVVQSSSVEELGMGNAVPEESDLSNVESSYTGDLAATGANDIWPILFVIGGGCTLVGVVLLSWRKPRSRSKRRANVPQAK
ncbi:MAG TPA: hypothetical protein VF281_04060 [Candidatus Saccharimonadales bacterium]